jgi:hypothetical protein
MLCKERRRRRRFFACGCVSFEQQFRNTEGDKSFSCGVAFRNIVSLCVLLLALKYTTNMIFNLP